MSEPERVEVSPEVPPAVRMALRVLLNHVEPGWENCAAVVRFWLDEITRQDAGR